MKNVVVIGAGITGVTSAYALARRGYSVTVVDRHRYPAMETSFANGGQLSASNAEVWNSWSTVLKGLKWMMRRDAPLLMNPWPSAHKYRWLAEFCANIPRHRANTIETARLAVAARAHLFEMADAEGIDFDLERRGILHIYRNRASFDAASASNGLLCEGGVRRFAVTPEEMQAIEPTLHGSFYGGFYTPDDSTGDIHKFTCGLAAACGRHGVDFRLSTAIDAVRPDGKGVTLDLSPDDRRDDRVTMTADAVLVCAGIASRRFAAMLGDRVNIYPVKGYSITVGLDDAVSRDAAPTVSLLDEDAKIVTSRLGRDRFRVAGTAEFTGENRDIRADRIKPLVDWAAKLFPAMSTEKVVPWAGLRPMTPNMLPRVGRGKLPGVFYNTGHGHLGWTLSAATADLVAAAVDDQLGGASLSRRWFGSTSSQAVAPAKQIRAATPKEAVQPM